MIFSRYYLSVLVTGILLVSCLFSPQVYGQQASPNYTNSRGGFGSAGGTGQSPNYSNLSAFGQPAGSTGSSGSYTNYGGLLHEGSSKTMYVNGFDFWAAYDLSGSIFENWAQWNGTAEEWLQGDSLLGSLSTYLSDEYALRLLIYSEGEGNLLDVLGYDYDAQGNISGVWIADAQGETGQTLLAVLFDLDSGLWVLDPNNLHGYANWIIAGVQAFVRNTVTTTPEPGTIVLFGIGLFGMLAFGRSLIKRRKSTT